MDLMQRLAECEGITRGQWQRGLTGNPNGSHMNIVAFDGADIVGVAFVPGEHNREMVALAPELKAEVLRLHESMREISRLTALAISVYQAPECREEYLRLMQRIAELSHD